MREGRPIAFRGHKQTVVTQQLSDLDLVKVSGSVCRPSLSVVRTQLIGANFRRRPHRSPAIRAIGIRRNDAAVDQDFDRSNGDIVCGCNHNGNRPGRVPGRNQGSDAALGYLRASSTALCTFKMPSVATRSFQNLDSSTDFRRISRTCRPLSDGLAEATRPAAPATCGDEKDVPLTER